MRAATLPVMRPIFSLLFSALFLQVGCANLLGLGELTYDEPAESGGAAGEHWPASSIGGESARVPSGAGGRIPSDLKGIEEPLLPPAVEDDFFAQWAQGALVVASPQDIENSPYWVYDSVSGELSSYVVDLTGPDLRATENWQGAPLWTHFLAFPTVEGDVLMGYQDATGIFEQVLGTGGEGNWDTLYETVGTEYRSHLFVAPLHGEWLVFSYTASTGRYRYSSADRLNEGESIAGDGQWQADWSHLQSFTHRGREGVLKFSAARGLLQFDRLEKAGIPVEQWSLALNIQATLMVTFRYAEGMGILLYDSSSGKITRATIVEGPSGEALQVDESVYFRSNLTSITPLSAEGEPWAITFTERTGIAELRRLIPLEDAFPVIIK